MKSLLVIFSNSQSTFQAGYDVNDGLRDGERAVQVTQSLELPILAFDGDIELLDTLRETVRYDTTGDTAAGCILLPG